MIARFALIGPASVVLCAILALLCPLGLKGVVFDVLDELYRELGDGRVVALSVAVAEAKSIECGLHLKLCAEMGSESDGVNWCGPCQLNVGPGTRHVVQMASVRWA